MTEVDEVLALLASGRRSSIGSEEANEEPEFSDLTLEVGVDLVPLVDRTKGGEILDRIVSIRRQFREGVGVLIPSILIQDNISLAPSEYRILFRGVSVGRATLQELLALDPGGIQSPMEGLRWKEPAFGLEGVWIESGERDDATNRGYTVVDRAMIIGTHLTAIAQKRLADLFTWQDAQIILDELEEKHERVVRTIDDNLPFGTVVEVFRNLLREEVAIVDRVTIIEAMAAAAESSTESSYLTEFVRRALGASIVEKFVDSSGTLNVIHLDPEMNGAVGPTMTPETAASLITGVTEEMKAFEHTDFAPVLLCGDNARENLAKILLRFIPDIRVLALGEVPRDVKIRDVRRDS